MASKKQRYIAFLRAINVGGRVVKMDELKVLFTAMKLSAVETFIASGNVIFETAAADAAAIEATIEQRLEKSLGYRVETFLRTPAQLAPVAVQAVFSDEEIGSGSLSVGFLKGQPPADAGARLTALPSPIDQFRLHGRELYWLCSTKINETKITGAMLERAMGGMKTTMRNITTVRKLVAKYPAS